MQEKIALCLFGFIRDINNIDNIKNTLIDKLNVNKFDIYYSIPNIIDEFSEDSIDKYTITENLKQFSKDIYLDFFEYDISNFVKESLDLNLPFILQNKLYPCRILSMLKSITLTCELLKNNIKNKSYDLIILTRLDILNTINKLDNLDDIIENTKKDISYVWRFNPYYNGEDAEDRFMLISQNLAIDFANLYDYVINLYSKDETDNMYSENIIGNYLKYKKIDNNLFILKELDISLLPSRDYKYSKFVYDKLLNLYEKVKNDL